MQEIKKLIELCRQLMYQLRYYKDENRKLEEIVNQLKSERDRLQGELLEYKVL